MQKNLKHFFTETTIISLSSCKRRRNQSQGTTRLGTEDLIRREDKVAI